MKLITKYPERMAAHRHFPYLCQMCKCTLLLSYVCYKAAHIYQYWTTGGPQDACYNHSAS